MVMVTKVASRRYVIFSAFSETITRRVKDAAWAEVTAAVNHVGSHHRNDQDSRKKFRDYRSVLKNRLAKHQANVKKKRKTGKLSAVKTTSNYLIQ